MTELAVEKVDAWMPLWIGAYLADTMALSRDSHGGYLLLLFAYWRNKGPLPDDDEDMAGITKSTPAEWKKLRPRLAKFFSIEDGMWSHGRADAELAKAGMHKANAVSKAKAGAEARWKNHRKQCSDDAPSNAQALHKQCPTPSPTSSTPSVKKKAPAAPSGPSVADLIAAGFDEPNAIEFIATKVKRKAPLTDRAWKDHLRESDKAGWTPLAAAEKVMAKTWKGFEARYVVDEAPSTSPKSSETSFTRDRKAQASAWMGSAAPQSGEIIDMEQSNVTRLSMG